MIALPCFLRSTVLAFCSVPASILPRKRSLLVNLFVGLLLTGGAWNRAHSQQVPQHLRHHVHREVSAGQAPLLGPMPSDQELNLSIVLPLRNTADLTSLLRRLYDPSNPDYRRFLTVAQFTEQFGPTVEDYQRVVAFAESNGFTVTDMPANRLIVPVRGTVDQINRAFNVSMNSYQHPTESRTFFSPDREPSLNLDVPIAHISGLNNFSIPQPMLRRVAESQPIANLSGSGPGGSYLGSDMRAAYYGGTTLDGGGQAVGVLEFDGYYSSDVDLTFTTAGQSYKVPVNNVLLDGVNGQPVTSGGEAEVVLDIVQAIGMAPGLSQVRVYMGRNDASILNSMAAENLAKELSCSWGWLPEDPSVADTFFQEFAAQGQSFFTSSGDDGAFDAAINPYFYPQEDMYVTAVGGTHLATSGPGGTWVDESAWNSYGGGSGGGVSPDGIPLPSWQTGLANSANGGSSSLRNVPDVAMEADADNFFCSMGQCWGGAAGTSFAAPRWAGFMALINQQAVEAGTAPLGGIGFINPAIYSIGSGGRFSNDFPRHHGGQQ
ncbi:MAG TPA: S53 family peptidase [Terracidiphilus sp.]|jgi:subtilase family serine protease